MTQGDETEWAETVDAGWNKVVGADSAKIVNVVQNAEKGVPINEYGIGNAAEKIVDIFIKTGILHSC